MITSHKAMLAIVMLNISSLRVFADDIIKEPLCGPVSLGFVMRQCGIYIRPDDILVQTGYTHSLGTTLGGLKYSAERHGLHCECIKLSLGQLQPLLGPYTYAIVYHANHFAVLAARDDQLLYIDPLAKSQTVVSGDEWHREYNMLLLSVNPLPIACENSARTEKIFCHGLVKASLIVLSILVVVLILCISVITRNRKDKHA